MYYCVTNVQNVRDSLSDSTHTLGFYNFGIFNVCGKVFADSDEVCCLCTTEGSDEWTHQAGPPLTGLGLDGLWCRSWLVISLMDVILSNVQAEKFKKTLIMLVSSKS